MPIYEYRCSSCGHELEVLQKFSDAPLSTCPSCHRNALAKKVSAAGFQLKGSGWYVTDFKGGNAKPTAKAGDGGGKDGVAGAEAKSETKTETKTESATAAPATTSTSGSTTGS
jgi:putative FmdB family regulatory protein